MEWQLNIFYHPPTNIKMHSKLQCISFFQGKKKGIIEKIEKEINALVALSLWDMNSR